MSRRTSVASALLALSLAGCGFGAVTIEPYDVQPGGAEVCAKVLQDLPEVVGDDAVRRDLDPESLPAAAWGHPAIVLRCSVPVPAAYRPDATLLDIEGVGWFAEDGDGGTFFTSTDRQVLVEVAIPDDYAPEGLILQDIAPAVAAHVPERALR